MMKHALGILLMAAISALACQRADEAAPSQLPQTLQAVATPATPMLEAEPSLALTIESIQIAKIISPVRPPERTDDAPAKELIFAALSLKKRLPPRAEVLLVPLNAELTALRTQVTQVAAVENPCSSALPKLYETKLRSVTNQDWLNASPFEVCLIYPALKTVRALDREKLDAAQLPAKVVLTNITAALDTNDDQQPEVLLVEYCCDKPQADRQSCDLTCSAVYVRDAKGRWRIVETQTPC
jgi:hypothetical protein